MRILSIVRLQHCRKNIKYFKSTQRSLISRFPFVLLNIYQIWTIPDLVEYICIPLGIKWTISFVNTLTIRHLYNVMTYRWWQSLRVHSSCRDAIFNKKKFKNWENVNSLLLQNLHRKTVISSFWLGTETIFKFRYIKPY